VSTDLGGGTDRLATLRRRLAAVGPSEWAGAVVSVLAALFAGRLVIGLGSAVVALLAGGLLAAVIHLLRGDRPLAHAGGMALLPLASLLQVASLTVPLGVLTEAERGLPAAAVALVTVIAVGTVGFAAALFASRAPGERRVWRGTKRLVRGLLGALLVLVVVASFEGVLGGFVGDVVGVAVGGFFDVLLAGGALRALAPYTLPLALLCAGVAGRAAARRLPVADVVAPERRDSVRETVARVERGAFYLAVGGLAGLLAAVFLGIAVQALLYPEFATALGPALGPLVGWLLTTGLLRVPLLLALLASVVGLLGYRLLLVARRLTAAYAVRLLTPSVAGGLVAVAYAAVLSQGAVSAVVRAVEETSPGAADLLQVLDPFPLVIVVVVAAGWLTAVSLALVVAAGRLAPRRAVGPAFAAAATFVLALAVVATGSAAGLLVAALALVVWDAGELAGGVRAELGDAPTRRAELVHLGGSLAVGLLGVVVAAVLFAVRPTLGGPSALTAFALTAAAAVAILYSL
jgi:hypothetical protein